MDPKNASVTPEMLELLARDFVVYLRNLRLDMHISQEKFGRLMGVANKSAKITVSRWENGTHAPQKRYLIKFLAIQKRHQNQKTGNK